MKTIEELKGKQIHTRKITVEIFSAGANRIVVEGKLDDTREASTLTLRGRRLKPGPVHGMVVRFLVGDIPPTILDAEVDMQTVPMKECFQTADSIKKLVGLPIVYGYSKAVKDRIGGINGCVHVGALVLAMGGAVVQGITGNRSRSEISGEIRRGMVNYIKNSCYVWRDDGQLFHRIIEEIEGENK